MKSKDLIKVLNTVEQLKCEVRHSWTSTKRQESVAEHSWRLCFFALLLKHELPDYDMDKVIKMGLIHDLGEAITGDIPSFNKNEMDEKNEKYGINQILGMLDSSLRMELEELFIEMDEKKTKESKLLNALDKLEAVIQHNEAPLETWIPIELELNLTYGFEETTGIKVLEKIRQHVRRDTLNKLSGHRL
ncbi:MAG: HD domain-containing protein [Solirubrobacterales bacterium]